MLVGYRWLDDRIAIRDVFDDVGSKYVPPHVNIFYCFGCQGCWEYMWPTIQWPKTMPVQAIHVTSYVTSGRYESLLVYQIRGAALLCAIHGATGMPSPEVVYASSTPSWVLRY